MAPEDCLFPGAPSRQERDNLQKVQARENPTLSGRQWPQRGETGQMLW